MKKNDAKLEAVLTRLKKIEKESFCKEDSMVATLPKEIAKVVNRVVVAEVERAVPRPPPQAAAAAGKKKGAGAGAKGAVSASAGGGDTEKVIVGYLIYSNNLKSDGCSKILKVAVEPASRRMGVASALMAAALELSKAERSPAMQLHVALTREPAYQLYLKHGFAVVSTYSDYYAPGRDAFLMERKL